MKQIQYFHLLFICNMFQMLLFIIYSLFKNLVSKQLYFQKTTEHLKWNEEIFFNLVSNEQIAKDIYQLYLVIKETKRREGNIESSPLSIIFKHVALFQKSWKKKFIKKLIEKLTRFKNEGASLYLAASSKCC